MRIKGNLLEAIEDKDSEWVGEFFTLLYDYAEQKYPHSFGNASSSELMECDSFSTVSPEKLENKPKGAKKEKINELRKQGLSIGQVAKKLGLSYQAVSKEWNH